MLDDAHEAYLRQVTREVREALGPLAGVFLHGSAAMGGFVPGRSDLDVLTVATQELDAPSRERIASQLSPDAPRALPAGSR